MVLAYILRVNKYIYVLVKGNKGEAGTRHFIN
jgi:hypothetical protein